MAATVVTAEALAVALEEDSEVDMAVATEDMTLEEDTTWVVTEAAATEAVTLEDMEVVTLEDMEAVTLEDTEVVTLVGTAAATSEAMAVAISEVMAAVTSADTGVEILVDMAVV